LQETTTLWTYEDVHLLVHAVVQKEIVAHPDTMRLHGMSGAVIKVSDLRCNLKARYYIGRYTFMSCRDNEASRGCEALNVSTSRKRITSFFIKEK
jgi:hypothetical protein